MPTTITQSYSSEKQAREAAATLRKTFRDDLVKVEKRYLGNASVSVEAEPEQAITAIKILNGQVSAPSTSTASGIRNNPAPLSSLLHLPVLWNRKPRVTLIDEPAPLSRLLGLPVLIKR
jgi:hypothetical protein